MSTELLDALLVLESEKGISKDIIIDAIEAALISA
ncbi:NusA N-terminal domain-containing protein, partial [Bacillus cereus]|nr:NusA N-terminal domain-containing protein [Bacillus cereus]